MGSDSIFSFGFSHEFSEGVLLTHNCALELRTGRLYLINLLQDLKGNPAHSSCFSKYNILRGNHPSRGKILKGKKK